MNAKRATISVVIPAYNASSTIRRALDSVLAQSHAATEIIVVDDGSTDNTASIVREYGARVQLITQANARTAVARNTGIECCRGDLIAFLDADDFWNEAKLARQAEVFETHPDVGVIAGCYQTHSPGVAHRELQRNAPDSWYDRIVPPSATNAFTLGTRMWTGTVMVRRTTLGDLRFVSGLEPAEDRDLWIRVAARTSVFLMSQSLSTCVLESGSLSRTDIEKDCQAMLAVIDRHKKRMKVSDRLVWRSYTLYRWAAMTPKPSSALPLILWSFCVWPVSLSRIPTMQSLGRLRRMLRIFGDLGRAICGSNAGLKSREATA